VFEIVYTEGGDPAEIVEARGLKQVTDTGAIEAAVDEIIAANPAQVEKAKQNPKLAGWFVGQVMKATGGKANPKAVNEIVTAKLGLLTRRVRRMTGTLLHPFPPVDAAPKTPSQEACPLAKALEAGKLIIGAIAVCTDPTGTAAIALGCDTALQTKAWFTKTPDLAALAKNLTRNSPPVSPSRNSTNRKTPARSCRKCSNAHPRPASKSRNAVSTRTSCLPT
jgi:hypothetical protein